MKKLSVFIAVFISACSFDALVPQISDIDEDGVEDTQDNCTWVSNSHQEDMDQDGLGDVCDSCSLTGWDSDQDNICNYNLWYVGDSEDKQLFIVEQGYDNCPDIHNYPQTDVDGDYYGDACDNCPGVESDVDGDNTCNTVDNCPQISNVEQKDRDGDGVGDACDNCPDLDVDVQTDTDGDGWGNYCDLLWNDPTQPVCQDSLNRYGCTFTYDDGRTITL